MGIIKCPRGCGRSPKPGYTVCEDCLTKQRTRIAARVAPLKGLGLCRDCKDPLPVSHTKIRCNPCLEAQRQYDVGRRANQRTIRVASPPIVKWDDNGDLVMDVKGATIVLAGVVVDWLGRIKQ